MQELHNIKNDKRVGAQHGEVFLMPVDQVPEDRKVDHLKKFIVGHSESGHNHILESETAFEVMPGDEKHDLYVRLFEPAKVTHQKSFDIHETEVLAPGDYAVFIKTEYDPWAKVVRAVYD